MNWFRSSLSIFLIVFCVSCQNISKAETSRGKVHHVVICWLKEPGNADARRKIIDASYGLAEIPGVIEVRAGTVLPDTRPTVDSSFDVALVMTLDNEAALGEYVNHPLHRHAVETTIKPLVERYIAYDFVDGK